MKVSTNASKRNSSIKFDANGDFGRGALMVEDGVGHGAVMVDMVS